MLTVESLGVETVVLLAVKGETVHALLGAHDPVKEGEQTTIGVRAGAALFFDGEGQRIASAAAKEKTEAAYGT